MSSHTPVLVQEEALPPRHLKHNKNKKNKNNTQEEKAAKKPKRFPFIEILMWGFISIILFIIISWFLWFAPTYETTTKKSTEITNVKKDQ